LKGLFVLISQTVNAVMKKNKCFPSWSLLALSFVILLMGGFSDEDLRYKRIRDALNRYMILFPQQKVYLHLDKNVYWGGDNLWIKAYVVNGLDHLPDTVSTNLYVEVISPSHTRVEIKRLQLFKGFGIGDFTLSDTLPEGLYQIRAYTAWMQNFDTEFYFEKNFQVNNPRYSTLISPREARLNKREIENLETKSADIDIQFMPEGGYLVNGLQSVVAFKAINKAGKGVDISGSVFDKTGNRITDFQSIHKGIGTFTITPAKNVKYYARVTVGGNELKADLPEPVETGVVMHVENSREKAVLSLVSNKQPSNDPVANELIVIGQVGGRIYYSSIVRLREGKAMMEISKKGFPSGIMQLTVFSGRGLPLAERLIFINLQGFMKIHFIAFDSSTYEGDKIALHIDVKDSKNMPVAANLSLSVTREMNGQYAANHDNILSNLLLSSDIKGFVEDPLDYFDLPKEESEKAFDALMLTQGWRRFQWDQVLSGDYPKIHYPEEKGITVSGKITRDVFNLPLKNCKVQLSIMDAYNDVFTLYSSHDGTFSFENLVYYDTVHVKIEAWRPSGKRSLVIQLAAPKEDEVTSHQGDYTLTTFSNRDKTEHRLELIKENQELNRQMKEAMDERKKNSMEGIYGDPDYVLYYEDFNMNNGNILDVLQGRVPGVQITGNSVIIRGLNSLYGSNQPLYLIDGIPVMDANSITSIPLEDIERVEILKGPKTAIYGSRGANGVIAVYTKRGHFMVRGKIEFSMLGYSTPRQFYQPKYEPEKEPENNYTVLWEPVIMTDSSGRAVVVFNKPSHGRYRFDLQGISYEGHTGYYEEVIQSE
jgi:TonB-dependent SusC/RagA subfamily outer membrane receptor